MALGLKGFYLVAVLRLLSRETNSPNELFRNYTQDRLRVAMNIARLTLKIPMRMKLFSVFLFNFRPEVLVFVVEYFDVQPACLNQFEYETNVY